VATNENDLFNAVTGSLGQLLGAGSLGAIIGAVAIIVVALIKRQPPMAALIDARIRLLIEGYEKRIAELKDEIDDLEAKVGVLTHQLEAAREQRGFGL
jgi:hypothetical protein